MALSRAKRSPLCNLPLELLLQSGAVERCPGFAQMTRFLPPRVREFFTECVSWAGGGDGAGVDRHGAFQQVDPAANEGPRS